MRTLALLIVGAIIGVGIYIAVDRHNHSRPPDQSRVDVSAGAERLKDKWNETAHDLRLDNLRDELSKTGRVIRKKASHAGEVIADKANDAKVTAQIKTKFATEPAVSASNISVDTTDGIVTLSGKAHSIDEVAKAMQIALDVEGVSQVVSTIQVAGNVTPAANPQ
jgi:osmotically-inducible protein OsmY